jgi:hypothetical protein
LVRLNTYKEIGKRSDDESDTQTKDSSSDDREVFPADREAEMDNSVEKETGKFSTHKYYSSDSIPQLFQL